MKTYEFSIIASGLDPEAEDFESSFYDAGCDDALIAFQKGHIIVDFAREADSLEDAITSAVEAVKKAGAQVDRVEPDPLVNLTEISTRTGLTKAAISLYSKGDRAESFPPPKARVTSQFPLWDWEQVARWAFEHQKGDVTLEDAVQAAIFKEVNEAIESGEEKIGERLRNRAKEFAEELKAA